MTLPYGAPAARPWTFLYGPPQPAGGVTGEIAQAQSRTLTVRAGTGTNSQAECSINGRSQLARAMEELLTDMQVWWGDQLLFAGRIGATQDSLDADQHRVQVTAMDYREVLRRRMLLEPLVFTATPPGIIAWNLVQEVQRQPGGQLGIAPGIAGAMDPPSDYQTAAGDLAGDSIDALSQFGAFDWDITPYGTSDLRMDRWSGRRGEDRGLVLEYGGALVAGITRTVDPAPYANAVMVTGSGSLTPQFLAAPDIANRPEGRWDLAVGTNLVLAANLQSAALEYLANAEALVPTYSVTLQAGTWQGPDWLWLGDLVTVRIASGRLAVDDQLEVSELAFDISADGLETTTVTCGPIPFRLHQSVSKMLRRLRTLETR